MPGTERTGNLLQTSFYRDFYSLGTTSEKVLSRNLKAQRGKNEKKSFKMVVCYNMFNYNVYIGKEFSVFSVIMFILIPKHVGNPA